MQQWIKRDKTVKTLKLTVQDCKRFDVPPDRNYRLRAHSVSFQVDIIVILMTLTAHCGLHEVNGIK